MKTLLLIFALAVTASAQRRSDFLRPQRDTPIKERGFLKPYGGLTIIATSVCAAGQSADIISSTGYEGNARLRGGDGRMNRSKAIPLKLIACIAPLAIERKVGRTGRIIFRVVQLFGGGLGMYDAIHNWKVNR